MPPPRNALLIIKFGAIGDVIMTIPAAYAMHSAGYTVDWYCGRAVAPLLRLYPWINVFEVDDAALLRGSKFTQLRQIVRLWSRLVGKRYDVCATLYYDSRYKLLSLPIRARRKFNLSKTGRDHRLLPSRHHSSEYARILLADLPTNLTDTNSPAQLAPLPFPHALPAIPAIPAPSRERIVLVPAGSRNIVREQGLRRWPVENYVAVAEQLLAKGFEIALLGGPDDAWASPYFTHLPVLNLINKLTLLESLALLNTASLVVTHDTGPLHMAGASSASVVAIFGPTDPHTFAPQRDNVTALWGGEGFACRPCYDGRDFAECPDNACVRQITVTMVLEEAETLLQARHESRSLPPCIRVPRHTPPMEFVTIQQVQA